MSSMNAMDALVGGRPLALQGRLAWALQRLIEAGDHGCSYIDEPAPRWSAYIHNLRKLGFSIETKHEYHCGQFPGRHARYYLRGIVTLPQASGAAA
jgi:hypothetical protein